jgi:hypothetical protein
MNQQTNEAGNLPQRRIIAVFQPQAWVNDYATDIDGRQEVDVTDAVLRRDLHRIHALQDYRDSTDTLVDSRKLGHDGPSTVQVTDSVCVYFGVNALYEITQAHLDQVRSEIGRKLPDVQLMAGAFLMIVEAGKALSSAELCSFLSPDVETSIYRQPWLYRFVRTGSCRGAARHQGRGG